mgnify:CR=1 FL=1
MYNFPDQDIPKSKKTKDWHKQHVQNAVSFIQSNEYGRSNEAITRLFNSYNGILTQKETEIIKLTLTDQYGTNLGVPYMVYPLIKTKIDQIAGIYAERPVKKRAYAIDKESVAKKLEYKLDLIEEELFREKNEEFKQYTGIELDTNNPQIKLPNDIEEFMAKDYKMMEEEIANDVITNFLEVEKNKRLILSMLKSVLISEQVHAKIYVDNGVIKWRMVHPNNAIFDLDPKSDVNENQNFFIEYVPMSENEILNTFTLDKETKALVKSYFKNDYFTNATRGGIDINGWFSTDNKTKRVNVVELDWKSQKNVRFIEDENKHTGEPIVKKLDDDYEYKKREKERLRTLEVFEHRFCIMLGPDIVLDYGEREYRNSRKSNPRDILLDSVTLKLNNTLGETGIQSIAALLLKLQDFASELLFTLRLTAKKNKGKIMLYDVAQTPREYFKNGDPQTALNRVLHHAVKDSMVLINSKDKSQRQTFNQFTAIDLGTKEMLQDIINALATIEMLADKWIGLSPEAQGNVGQYQTASGSDKAVKGSLIRLENIFMPFDNFIQSLLDKVIIKAKQTYKDNDVTQFIFGDLKSKVIAFSEKFFLADYGMYFGYPNVDQQKKEIINRAAEMLLSNAQSDELILSAIRILNEDTSSEAEAILVKAIESKSKLQEQLQQSQMQAMQQQQQAMAEEKDKDRQVSRDGHLKDVIVANIYAENKTNVEKIKQGNENNRTLADIEKEFLAAKYNYKQSEKNQKTKSE